MFYVTSVTLGSACLHACSIALFSFTYHIQMWSKLQDWPFLIQALWSDIKIAGIFHIPLSPALGQNPIILGKAPFKAVCPKMPLMGAGREVRLIYKYSGSQQVEQLSWMLCCYTLKQQIIMTKIYINYKDKDEGRKRLSLACDSPHPKQEADSRNGREEGKDFWTGWI